jgi:hypothetical protein
MTPKKERARSFTVIGFALLAAGILFSWMGFKARSEKTGEKAAMQRADGAKPTGTASRLDLSGDDPPGDSMAEATATPRSASKPNAAPVTGSPDIRLDVRAVSKVQPAPEAGYELRGEKRELSMAITDLYRGDSSPPPESLSFPLFDGKSVHLKALRHQSMGTEQGVVFAEADGELEGGHVLLSYVGTALAGMIHLPTRNEFYEIRTAPDGRSHILTQLNPEKMPVCRGCTQHTSE